MKYILDEDEYKTLSSRCDEYNRALMLSTIQSLADLVMVGKPCIHNKKDFDLGYHYCDNCPLSAMPHSISRIACTKTREYSK